MGRRKIEIKAIKDDRNRSVTFLKRKGGLFKKAHELSVLCSVDVAVFIFGSNKKLYEYSSSDMRDLVTRYTYHGGPNEHKGPSDFNGGADEDEDEDENASPPQSDGMEGHMMPPHFATSQPPFPHHLRHQTASVSPPMPSGVGFPQHPAHAVARGHTPQPQIGSRPGSRNDMRRMPPSMVQTGHPPPHVNGYAFMPSPAIYNPHNPPPNMPHSLPQPSPHYPYGQPAAHAQHLQYMEDQRRASLPPSFPPQGSQPQPAPRHSVSPPQPQHQPLPPHSMPPHSMPQSLSHPSPHMSPPQPQSQHIGSPPQVHEPQPPPPPAEPKPEPPAQEKPGQHGLLEPIKRAPQRKQHSIFTPIDEHRSLLSQHLAAFGPSKGDLPIKMESPSRSQSVDVGAIHRDGFTTSPPAMPQRSNTGIQPPKPRTGSVSGVPEAGFTPPSRSNSLRDGALARPSLKLTIPDEPSETGSATAESSSPRNSTEATSQSTKRNDTHASGNVVLPPPSPSASALLSAGATGPPNPFARPHPHSQNVNNVDTPVSGLPSRFLNGEFLPSPSSFYPEWNYRGDNSNTLPSPLNFATPVVGSGPSFLRDDNSLSAPKRKSPEISGEHERLDMRNEAKRVKVDS